MENITTLINSFYPEPHASLLSGILLGRKLFVTNTFYNQLKEVGLIHIVVLSGMNITLLTAIVMNTFVTFIGRKWASILTIGIIVIFVLFVGAEAPIIRAAMMGTLSLIGLLFGRRTTALYLLFLSGVVMILINVSWLTSVSFQLSFAATLGIILFGALSPEERSQSHIVPKPNTFLMRVKDSRLYQYFAEELRISVAAQVFTLPIIFWYFRQISFISPLANILVAWMIAPIMILGLLVILGGAISWHVGFVLSWILYPLLQTIVWVVELLSRIPMASVKM